MRKVSVVNSLRGMLMSILDISWGCAFAKDKNLSGLKLWRAIRCVFTYRNMVSLIAMVSVKPIISPSSTLNRNSSQLEKYFSSLSRKYRNILASMNTGEWLGKMESWLVNSCFLFTDLYDFLQFLVTDYSLYQLRNLVDNSARRVGWSFQNRIRGKSFNFHFITSKTNLSYYMPIVKIEYFARNSQQEFTTVLTNDLEYVKISCALNRMTRWK